MSLKSVEEGAVRVANGALVLRLRERNREIVSLQQKLRNHEEVCEQYQHHVTLFMSFYDRLSLALKGVSSLFSSSPNSVVAAGSPQQHCITALRPADARNIIQFYTKFLRCHYGKPPSDDDDDESDDDHHGDSSETPNSIKRYEASFKRQFHHVSAILDEKQSSIQETFRALAQQISGCLPNATEAPPPGSEADEIASLKRQVMLLQQQNAEQQQHLLSSEAECAKFRAKAIAAEHELARQEAFYTSRLRGFERPIIRENIPHSGDTPFINESIPLHTEASTLTTEQQQTHLARSPTLPATVLMPSTSMTAAPSVTTQSSTNLQMHSLPQEGGLASTTAIDVLLPSSTSTTMGDGDEQIDTSDNTTQTIQDPQEMLQQHRVTSAIDDINSSNAMITPASDVKKTSSISELVEMLTTTTPVVGVDVGDQTAVNKDLQQRYEQLQQQHDTLRVKHEALTASVDKLEQEKLALTVGHLSMVNFDVNHFTSLVSGQSAPVPAGDQNASLSTTQADDDAYFDSLEDQLFSTLPQPPRSGKQAVPKLSEISSQLGLRTVNNDVINKSLASILRIIQPYCEYTTKPSGSSHVGGQTAKNDTTKQTASDKQLVLPHSITIGLLPLVTTIKAFYHYSTGLYQRMLAERNAKVLFSKELLTTTTQRELEQQLTQCSIESILMQDTVLSSSEDKNLLFEQLYLENVSLHRKLDDLTSRLELAFSNQAGQSPAKSSTPSSADTSTPSGHRHALQRPVLDTLIDTGLYRKRILDLENRLHEERLFSRHILSSLNIHTIKNTTQWTREVAMLYRVIIRQKRDCELKVRAMEEKLIRMHGCYPMEVPLAVLGDVPSVAAQNNATTDSLYAALDGALLDTIPEAAKPTQTQGHMRDHMQDAHTQEQMLDAVDLMDLVQQCRQFTEALAPALADTTIAKPPLSSMSSGSLPSAAPSTWDTADQTHQKEQSVEPPVLPFYIKSKPSYVISTQYNPVFMKNMAILKSILHRRDKAKRPIKIQASLLKTLNLHRKQKSACLGPGHYAVPISDVVHAQARQQQSQSTEGESFTSALLQQPPPVRPMYPHKPEQHHPHGPHPGQPHGSGAQDSMHHLPQGQQPPYASRAPPPQGPPRQHHHHHHAGHPGHQQQPHHIAPPQQQHHSSHPQSHPKRQSIHGYPPQQQQAPRRKSRFEPVNEQDGRPSHDQHGYGGGYQQQHRQGPLPAPPPFPDVHTTMGDDADEPVPCDTMNTHASSHAPAPTSTRVMTPFQLNESLLLTPEEVHTLQAITQQQQGQEQHLHTPAAYVTPQSTVDDMLPMASPRHGDGDGQTASSHVELAKSHLGLWLRVAAMNMHIKQLEDICRRHRIYTPELMLPTREDVPNVNTHILYDWDYDLANQRAMHQLSMDIAAAHSNAIGDSLTTEQLLALPPNPEATRDELHAENAQLRLRLGDLVEELAVQKEIMSFLNDEFEQYRFVVEGPDELFTPLPQTLLPLLPASQHQPASAASTSSVLFPSPAPIAASASMTQTHWPPGDGELLETPLVSRLSTASTMVASSNALPGAGAADQHPHTAQPPSASNIVTTTLPEEWYDHLALQKRTIMRNDLRQQAVKLFQDKYIVNTPHTSTQHAAPGDSAGLPAIEDPEALSSAAYLQWISQHKQQRYIQVLEDHIRAQSMLTAEQSMSSQTLVRQVQTATITILTQKLTTLAEYIEQVENESLLAAYDATTAKDELQSVLTQYNDITAQYDTLYQNYLAHLGTFQSSQFVSNKIKSTLQNLSYTSHELQKKLPNYQEEVHALELKMDTLQEQLQDAVEARQKQLDLFASLPEELLSPTRSGGGSSSADSNTATPRQQQAMIDDFKKQLFYYKRRLKCSICTSRERDVVISKCAHTFCSTCMTEAMSARNRKCPQCAITISQSDVKRLHLG